MTEADVKAIVRYRDGFCCTECGMGQAEHVRRHGSGLHVHRLTPGGPYTLEGCVTICVGCHGPKPKAWRVRRPRPAKPIRARCELDAAELRAVEDAAHLCRLSVASFIRVALIETATHPERAAAWAEIAERLDQRAPGERAPGRPKKPKGKDPA